MKKLYLFYSLLLIVLVINCSGGYDNYNEPEETLKGTVIDKNTKKGMETQVDGVRLKLMELSWSNNPAPYYFNTKQDGTFKNTKIFKGNYNILVEGPFVPLIQYDANGKVIIDKSVTIDISGVTELNFEVEPFLNLEWVGAPVLEGDGKISVRVKITRGTADINFQQHVTDVLFCLNSNPYVGDNNRDDRLSMRMDFDPNNQDFLDGRVLKLISNSVAAKNRTYYLRVGARINKESFGGRRYNYTTVTSITVP